MLRYGMRLTLMLLLVLTMSEFLDQVNGTKKFCGEALNDALDYICVHGFSRRIKRNMAHVADRLHKASEVPYGAEQVLLRRKWRALLLQADHVQGNMDEAGSEVEHRRRRRRIAHDCCSNGCTYGDIMEYCA